MKLSKVILLAGAAYLVYKNRDRIVATAQRIGFINAAKESNDKPSEMYRSDNDPNVIVMPNREGPFNTRY